MQILEVTEVKVMQILFVFEWISRIHLLIPLFYKKL